MLQVEKCDSNSRLVVYEDDNVNSGLKGLICFILPFKLQLLGTKCVIKLQDLQLFGLKLNK